jgi:hypothetical protein
MRTFLLVSKMFEGDRKWVKDFGASDKSQSVYELAA